jgi:RNA polymerase-binding transcription factor DksA
MMASNKKKTKKLIKQTIVFPRTLTKPIAVYLRGQLKSLRKRRKEIAKDDPFRDVTRVGDNASPDTDAGEQFGHARAMAMKEQLDRKIVQTRKALARIKIGKYGTCENCGNMIDTDRLIVYPETSLCVSCTRKLEKKGRA